MNREVTELWSDALGAAGTVIRYGHWGRAVLVFPSEQGKAWDFENNGMIGAVSNLIDEGRLKVYCVDSYDAASWSNQSIPLEERARQHGRYESWIVGRHHSIAVQHKTVRRATCQQGHQARARPVGFRRAPRLALLARPACPSPATILLNGGPC